MERKPWGCAALPHLHEGPAPKRQVPWQRGVLSFLCVVFAVRSEQLLTTMCCCCCCCWVGPGDRLKEATKINLSLSALGNVISALVDGKTGEGTAGACCSRVPLYVGHGRRADGLQASSGRENRVTECQRTA